MLAVGANSQKSDRYGKAPISESGRMVWIPEIGLGIGCEQGIYDGWQREWVYWYDRSGKRYLTAQELANLERQARLEAEALLQKYRDRFGDISE